MPESDRRKFLRVLFEKNFEVRALEWTDKEATGLDISLNGCRFNCKKSIFDGEVVSIVFKPGFELEGNVRWCWPIEWYFQAALHFENITQEEQATLKKFIEEVTGEDYKMKKDEETKTEKNVESVEFLGEDLDEIEDDLSSSIIDDLDQEEFPENVNEEDNFEKMLALEGDDLLNQDIEEPIGSASEFSDINQKVDFLHKSEEAEISTLSFAGKQVILYDLVKDQAELLNKYLSERAGIEVEYVTKKENLWRLMKIEPMDLVIIETGVTGISDSLEVLQQTKDQFPEVQFICLSGPVSLERRLQFLNAGAVDYLTRPVHLSTIAQSVLVNLSYNAPRDFMDDITSKDEMMANNEELQEELAIVTEQRDKARANAKANAEERDEAIAETKELEEMTHQLSEEKESLYLDETFVPDEEPIKDSNKTFPLEDLNGSASLLDDELKISEEVDLIEEDY